MRITAKKIRRIFRTLPKKRIVATSVVLAFAFIGTFWLLSGQAATPVVDMEAEKGVASAGAAAVSDTTASNGAAVRFGSGTDQSGTAFTFVSIPDTQRDMHTDEIVNRNFKGRLNWIVQNRESLNIRYVWHTGDLVDTDNLIFSSDLSVNPRYIPGYTIDHLQYERSSGSLKILENAGMPYALTIGNHDTGAVCGGPACPVVAGQTQPTPIEVRNTTTWNKYYPPSRFKDLVAFEPGKTDNAYRIFNQGGLTWMVLNLELWPRTEAVNWAKSVVAAHPKANVVVTTHSYLNASSGIEQTNGGYGYHSPQYVFDNLIKAYPNIRFVFSGHTGTSGFRTDTGTHGNKIYSFLDTYHDTTNNWMRLLSVDTARNTLTTKVYSSATNAYRTESAANVSLTGINWVR